MTDAAAMQRPPRWLHSWAVLTVCATFVLLVLGALVTTRRAGMADPVWPTTPWILAFISWQEPAPGFLLEHSHRLAGYVVGTCAIVLMLGLCRRDSRPWMKTLGMLSVVLIVVQGLLGGFRVLLDKWLGSDLAFIHGSFAQIVFAILCVIALCTSASWFDATDYSGERRIRTQRIALAVSIFIYMQVILGAFLRHTYSAIGPRGHFLGAFLVAGSVAWLCKEIWEYDSRDRALVRLSMILAAIVVFQISLGVEAWMSRYTSMGVNAQVILRTTHVATGFLIFATSILINMQARRRVIVQATANTALPLRRQVERMEAAR